MAGLRVWVARVDLYEMTASRNNVPAHQTDQLAEIVCSNSLKSDQPISTSSWLLKMKELSTLRISAAPRSPTARTRSCRQSTGRRPAAVFSNSVTRSDPKPNQTFTLHRSAGPRRWPSTRGLVKSSASGPLTSAALSESIRRFCGREHLYFYDAIIADRGRGID